MTMITSDRQTSPRTWAIVVWSLYIASAIGFPITLLVGAIIAYVKRDELADTPFATHMTSAICTFWVSLIATVIGVALAWFWIIWTGFLILIAFWIWLLFRTIRGLVRAIDNQPIADPTGWL